MDTRQIWLVVVACIVAGLTIQLLSPEPEGSPLLSTQFLGVMLATLPLALAINITARRRRSARREDSPDSVEFQAAHAARSATFGDTLVLGALLILALAVAPGSVPALWGMTFLFLAVGAFWLRYTLTLQQLRG